MSRILWLGNAPWCPSGYGEQAGLFVPRLAQQGHDLAVVCNWGLHGQPTSWNGFPCYPSDGVWGNRNLPIFAEALEADQVIALCDAFVLKPDSWAGDFTVANWAPVDHQPIPPQVLKVLQHERVRPVAMSRFGFDLMVEAGLEPLYVPHGVDTQLFRPQPEIRDQVRDGLGLPRDGFVVGMVAANTSSPYLCRKSFPQAFLAFSELARRHDDAWLYLHTDFAPQGIGIDLNVVADLARIPAGRVRYPDPASLQIGIPPQVVACTYQAFDVLLNPAMGEGFGIPILEAQACGVPVIASDHSAMPEITQAGWLVDGDPWLDYIQEAWFFNPSVAGIVDALEQAYAARDDRQLREDAVRFAAQYDADQVADRYWRPALEQLGAGLEVAA